MEEAILDYCGLNLVKNKLIEASPPHLPLQTVKRLHLSQILQLLREIIGTSTLCMMLAPFVVNRIMQAVKEIYRKITHRITFCYLE